MLHVHGGRAAGVLLIHTSVTNSSPTHSNIRSFYVVRASLNLCARVAKSSIYFYGMYSYTQEAYVQCTYGILYILHDVPW